MNETVAQMIEDSGEMWASARERKDSPVLITFSMVAGFPLYELLLEEGAKHPYWTIRERENTEEESAELTEAYHTRK